MQKKVSSESLFICILKYIYIYIYIYMILHLIRLYTCNMYIFVGTSPTSLRQSEFTTRNSSVASAQGAKVSTHCALFSSCHLLLLSDKSGKQTCTSSGIIKLPIWVDQTIQIYGHFVGFPENDNA